MKISVFGMGYVGLSNAILLAQKNEVSAIDVDPRKIDLINNNKSHSLVFKRRSLSSLTRKNEGDLVRERPGWTSYCFMRMKMWSHH